MGPRILRKRPSARGRELNKDSSSEGSHGAAITDSEYHDSAEEENSSSSVSDITGTSRSCPFLRERRRTRRRNNPGIDLENLLSSRKRISSHGENEEDFDDEPEFIQESSSSADSQQSSHRTSEASTEDLLEVVISSSSCSGTASDEDAMKLAAEGKAAALDASVATEPNHLKAAADNSVKEEVATLDVPSVPEAAFGTGTTTPSSEPLIKQSEPPCLCGDGALLSQSMVSKVSSSIEESEPLTAIFCLDSPSSTPSPSRAPDSADFATEDVGSLLPAEASNLRRSSSIADRSCQVLAAQTPITADETTKGETLTSADVHPSLNAPSDDDLPLFPLTLKGSESSGNSSDDFPGVPLVPRSSRKRRISSSQLGKSADTSLSKCLTMADVVRRNKKPKMTSVAALPALKDVELPKLDLASIDVGSTSVSGVTGENGVNGAILADLFDEKSDVVLSAPSVMRKNQGYASATVGEEIDELLGTEFSQKDGEGLEGFFDEAPTAARLEPFQGAYRKTRVLKWTPMMDELFFEALAMYGCDLMLVGTAFPNLSDKEISRKFAIEQKKHPGRIASCLGSKRRQLTTQKFEAIRGVIDQEAIAERQAIANGAEDEISLPEFMVEDLFDQKAEKSEKNVKAEYERRERSASESPSTADSSADLPDNDDAAVLFDGTGADFPFPDTAVSSTKDWVAPIDDDFLDNLN